MVQVPQLAPCLLVPPRLEAVTTGQEPPALAGPVKRSALSVSCPEWQPAHWMRWASHMIGRTWFLLSPVHHNSRRLRWPLRPVAKKEGCSGTRRPPHRISPRVAPPSHRKDKCCLPGQNHCAPPTERRNYGKTFLSRLPPH